MNPVPFMFYDILANKALILATLANTACVYMFLNNINGHSYIGSTVNMAKRFSAHFHGLPSNLLLQRAFKKYGLSNFSLIILHICEPIKAVLLAEEQLAISLFKPVYNILLIAGSSLGHKHTAVARANMSAAMKGKYGGENSSAFGRTGYSHPMFGITPVNAVVVLLTDLDGNTIQEFPSMTALGSYLNITKLMVSRYVKTGRVFGGKYIFIRKP
jgi:predicted GIY-YIG superfamily endonuclease